MAFTHLHTHTAYSLLDGEGTIKKLVDRAKALGQTALAITDHGNMYGVIDFYEYAKSQGIHPILGCEVYVAARSRHDKVHEYDAQSYHLILLAENDEGYWVSLHFVSCSAQFHQKLMKRHTVELYHHAVCLPLAQVHALGKILDIKFGIGIVER